MSEGNLINVDLIHVDLNREEVLALLSAAQVLLNDYYSTPASPATADERNVMEHLKSAKAKIDSVVIGKTAEKE